ncbi:MAG: AAA family ATPase [Hyphomonadaceae bacterium]|nr:AAA family ATPase [Hyphomonadaceae bacterium]
MRLSDKYRPRTFEDLVGQDDVAATLGALVKRDEPAPILLSGPWGTGKTSAALVYAQARNCDALMPSGSPCRSCVPCLAFESDERTWFFAEVDAARHGEREHGKYLNELARTNSMYDVRQRVIVVNEVHCATPAWEETLLGLFEAPGVAAFVLTTTAPDRVSGPLRSRCTHVRTRLLTNGELVAFGRDVCAAERIAFEPEALALVAASSGGHVRDFVMELERLSVGGGLTLPAAAAGLFLDWPDTALRVVTALARGEYGAAKVLVRDWTASPADKARALRDAYLFVAHVCFGPARACPEATVAFRLATPAVVEEAGAALAACPGGWGVPPFAFVLALAEQWGRAAPHLHDDGDLDVELTRVAHGVTPTDLLLPPVIVAPVSAPALSQRRTTVRAAVARAPRTAPRASFVTKADVRGEYRAATLLPQMYGVWFNTRLVLRWSDYGVTEWKDVDEREGVTERFSALTHELGLRVRDRVGDPEFRLHWLVQHEVTARGYESWLLLSLPVDEREAARAWIAAHLPVTHGVLVNALGVDVWRAPNVTGRAHAVHWSLVRELWRAVDPDLRDVDEAGRRVALRAVLGVPVQGPRAAGVLPDGARRWSTSQTLGSRVWAAAHEERFGFVSPVALRVWRALNTGWEADEFANRRTEAERRAAVIAEITAQFPPGQSALTDLTREKKICAFVESLPFDPLKRPRLRPLW